MTASQHTPRPLCAAAWRAIRRAVAALRHVNDQQTLMWETWWQANRATVPETGPLTWVMSLDGRRLAGRHLAAADDTRTGSAP